MRERPVNKPVRSKGINNLENYMEEEIITADEAQSHEDASAADESDVANLKDVLGKALGKEFADDESALKSVKDTFAYVGKVGKFSKHIDALVAKTGGDDNAQKYMEQIIENAGQPAPTPVVDDSKFISREVYEEDKFFAKNSELEEYRDILVPLAKASGKTLQDVANDEKFKGLVEKAKVGETYEKSKTMMPSNPRLGAASDALTQARELQNNGNTVGANRLATQAVLDAYRS
jgi:hypothetical protein